LEVNEWVSVSCWGKAPLEMVQSSPLEVTGSVVTMVECSIVEGSGAGKGVRSRSVLGAL
jgi:hypothetical protein